MVKSTENIKIAAAAVMAHLRNLEQLLISFNGCRDNLQVQDTLTNHLYRQIRAFRDQLVGELLQLQQAYLEAHHGQKKVVIKPGWKDAGTVGVVLQEIPKDAGVDQSWSVVLFDGQEDPSLHKTEGLKYQFPPLESPDPYKELPMLMNC